MSFAALLSALVAILEAAPALVKDVELLIAAFKGGGAPAAQALLASKAAADTADLETALQTPISGAAGAAPKA